MRKIRSFYLLVTIIAFQFFTAQNEFSKWYFGQYAGLDFTTTPPTALANSTMNAGEGVATMSDVNGNLLFYSNGAGIGNSNHMAMDNSSGMQVDLSSTQAVMIVKQPGSANLYYVFTTLPGNGASLGVRYSIVDMSLAAGLGSVTVKNATLHTSSCEKQVAVRHCNGKDVWIVTRDYGANQFRSSLLTSTGITGSPVISAIGETAVAGVSALGQLKISPDGRKLAMATMSASVPSTLGLGGFFLFDFNSASGVVSNSLTLLSTPNIGTGAGPYGVEFSPDGTKLYGTTSPALSPNFTCTLHQWNICAPSNSAIVASQYSLAMPSGSLGFGSLQRAIDGKIYVAIGAMSSSLGVINNPNTFGAGMNYVQNGLDVSPGYSRLGLPNFINPWTKPAPAPFTSSITCQKVNFSIPPVPTYSSGCSSTPYAPSSYLWNFGESGSGTANTSTLTNPVHTYSTTGIYTVSLILYSNCTNDTLQQTVTVTTPGPTLSVAGNYTICKGAKGTYTATGGSAYAWSNNTSGPTVTLQPSQTTVYSTTATLNGCQEAKQFTVTVDPCTGIDDAGFSENVRIFPNPVNDLLHVECAGGIIVRVRDLDGRVLKVESFDASGQSEVDLDNFNCGIYLIEIETFKTVYRSRVVKK